MGKRFFRKTTVNSGHRHKWMRGKKFTTVVDNHKHIINIKRKLARPVRKGGHVHKLL